MWCDFFHLVLATNAGLKILNGLKVCYLHCKKETKQHKKGEMSHSPAKTESTINSPAYQPAKMEKLSL